MDENEFVKYTNKRSNGKKGLMKALFKSALDKIPCVGTIVNRISEGIESQNAERNVKNSLIYLDKTKISKDDISTSSIIKIIRSSNEDDWDYEELEPQENYPKHIANLNYRHNMEISIKVIENSESTSKEKWMPKTFLDFDNIENFKWHNTSFIFSFKGKDLLNDSITCFNIDNTYIPFNKKNINGNYYISKEDYDFAKLLNKIAYGRCEQYLWFYTHQKNQNIVEDNYGEMSDIDLYRFLLTECNGEFIDYDDNEPHFDKLDEMGRMFLSLYK